MSLEVGIFLVIKIYMGRFLKSALLRPSSISHIVLRMHISVHIFSEAIKHISYDFVLYGGKWLIFMYPVDFCRDYHQIVITVPCLKPQSLNFK